MNEYCDQHFKDRDSLARIEASVVYIEKNQKERQDAIDAHIEQGEKPGGIRDRVKDLETNCATLGEAISALKKAEWKRVAVAGLAGGLAMRISLSSIEAIGQFLIKVAFAGQ